MAENIEIRLQGGGGCNLRSDLGTPQKRPCIPLCTIQGMAGTQCTFHFSFCGQREEPATRCGRMVKGCRKPLKVVEKLPRYRFPPSHPWGGGGGPGTHLSNMGHGTPRNFWQLCGQFSLAFFLFSKWGGTFGGGGMPSPTFEPEDSPKDDRCKTFAWRFCFFPPPPRIMYV